MKRLIFLFLFAFAYIGIQDVFSESPPENQAFELSVNDDLHYASTTFEAEGVKYSPVHRTVEQVIHIYNTLGFKTESGQPINKARDKLSFSGHTANFKGIS